MKPSLNIFTIVLLHIFHSRESLWASKFNTLQNNSGRHYCGFTYNPLIEGKKLKRGAIFDHGEDETCVVETVGSNIVLASCTNVK